MTSIVARPLTTEFHAVGNTTLTFSPKGDAEALAVSVIASAVHSLQVQAYEFSSLPIADAVIAAHQRGVVVTVIMDKRNVPSAKTGKYSGVAWVSTKLPALRAAGVPILIDASPTIAHSKIILVDGAVVVTGSFNFSESAQKTNTENLLVIRDAAVAEAYAVNFNWRASLSRTV